MPVDFAASGVAVIMAFFFIGSLLDVPFAAWSTFVLETRFGFNRTTPWLFVSDLLKQLGIQSTTTT